MHKRFHPTLNVLITLWLTATAFLFTTSAQAADQNRFLSKITLPSGQTAIVAEGDFEARSLGSFSVRLYQAADAPDATTFFSSGLIRPRDGMVEKVILADINADQHPEIIVIIRSVGSGNYLSAQAFSVDKNTLAFHASVDGLNKNANPITALQKVKKPN